MKKNILTLFFAGLLTLSASAQQRVKTFPTLEREATAAPLLAPSANVPSAINDKALGTKIFATQVTDESKYRSWLYFYDTKPWELHRVNIFDNEVGMQNRGLLHGAWGGDKYYGYYGTMNNPGQSMEWRGFKGFVSLDVRTGQYEFIKDMQEGLDNATVVWTYSYGDQGFPNIQDMTYNPVDENVYVTAKYQKDEKTDAVSRIYTVDKQTGDLQLVTELEEQILEFCFDYDGNMYIVTPYWKSNSDGTFNWSGTYLSVYDENMNPIDGKKFRIKNSEKQDVLANGYGSLSFNYTTGDLYLTSLIAPTDGSSNYCRLVKLDPNSGKYIDSQTFMPGNQIIGMYIPYYSADSRDAAGRATDINATPNAEGNLSVDLSWTNPTKTWSGDELKELAEVQVYRKLSYADKCALSSEDIYANSVCVATVQATAADLGKSMTWTDNAPIDGMNTYYIVPCRVSGEKGVPDSIRCAAGVDIPGVPTNFVATVAGEGVSLKWDAPVDGKNNGFISQADLRYDIVRNPGKVTVATDVAGTAYTDNTVAELQRTKFTYTIVAKNAKGCSDPVESNTVAAGMPPLPPVEFPITSADEADQWTAFENIGDGQLFEWAGWTNAYRVVVGSSTGDDWTASPAFRLEKGKTYVFTSKFRNDYPGVGHTISRYVGTSPDFAGMTTMIGEEKEYSSEYYYDANPVVAYEDKFTAPADGTYYFGFRISDHSGYDVMYFYGVDIEAPYEHDLKAADLEIFGNDVVSGDINKCKIIVKNNGAQTVEAGSYKVEVRQVLDGGNSQRGVVENTPIVRPGSTVEIPAEFIPVGDEGEFEFFAQVVYDKDECPENNTSKHKTINVLPYGDNTPWTMRISDGDEWDAPYFPFPHYDNDDGSQSLYVKSDFTENTSGSNTIERIGYEYTTTFEDDALPVSNVTVWMTNTDLQEFTSGVGDWVEESTMTQVFNGNVILYPGKGYLSMQLDTPFEYDPTKNLLVCVEHQGTGSSSFPVQWKVFNANGARNRSIRYWSPKASAKYEEKAAPVLYIGFKPERNGITEINGNAVGTVYYNAQTGKLVLGGAKVELFDLSGKLLRSYNGMSEVSPNLPAGMYVVKARTANGMQSVKVSVK